MYHLRKPFVEIDKQNTAIKQARSLIFNLATVLCYKYCSEWQNENSYIYIIFFEIPLQLRPVSGKDEIYW